MVSFVLCSFVFVWSAMSLSAISFANCSPERKKSVWSQVLLIWWCHRSQATVTNVSLTLDPWTELKSRCEIPGGLWECEGFWETEYNGFLWSSRTKNMQPQSSSWMGQRPYTGMIKSQSDPTGYTFNPPGIHKVHKQVCEQWCWRHSLVKCGVCVRERNSCGLKMGK